MFNPFYNIISLLTNSSRVLNLFRMNFFFSHIMIKYFCYIFITQFRINTEFLSGLRKLIHALTIYLFKSELFFSISVGYQLYFTEGSLADSLNNEKSLFKCQWINWLGHISVILLFYLFLFMFNYFKNAFKSDARN